MAIPILIVLKNDKFIKKIFIKKDVIVVGRRPECDIILPHPTISRVHLRIHSKPSSQQVFVEDLSSTHGSWISEKKIEPCTRMEMCEGDTLRVGGSSRVYKLHWISDFDECSNGETKYGYKNDVVGVGDGEIIDVRNRRDREEKELDETTIVVEGKKNKSFVLFSSHRIRGRVLLFYNEDEMMLDN